MLSTSTLWARPTWADSLQIWTCMRRAPGISDSPEEPRPVMPCIGLPEAFVVSFDQRSPHMLVVDLAPSMQLTIATSSSTRGVTWP